MTLIEALVYAALLAFLMAGLMQSIYAAGQSDSGIMERIYRAYEG
ncbi:MAG: hypothetical protein KGI69_01500 [Patescibacteria group bacterium]|nr:hypothetical protein [Patescibacteria group bacterium]